MAKNIARSKSISYSKKAEEFLTSAQRDYEDERFSACAFTAVQAMINANDAYTIHVMSIRGSSHHDEAVDLHEEAAKLEKIPSQKSSLRGLLR